MSFKNIFDSGGNEADSARQAADAFNKNTPGSGDVSEAVRKLESERDPWLVRQTAHGAFDVMGFLGPLFQKFHDVSADQRTVSEDPASTSGMASSAKNKAFENVQVKIRDEDLPYIGEDQQRKLKEAHDRALGFRLITTELGKAEGLALDPSHDKAYVADRSGQKLFAVDLTTGAKRVVASSLGDVNDVALDGNGTAYVTDWGGGRLLAVDLSTGSARKVTDGLPAYGVALDGKGKAYVADWSNAQLVAVDLSSGRKETIARDLAYASGVALDGKGKAYVGQKDVGEHLYEINLAGGAKREVTTLPGATTPRAALDGAGHAYVADPTGKRLYQVGLADGAQRVVATGVDTAHGLELDSGNGQIYVSNQAGQLWRISQRATEGLGKVNVVA
ncbi:hypothetical protein AB0K09_20990 [Streptomyces sp. NPDC049577]|uniref:Vgb family protein n=1 Tax=Streptomyces sp. NPDC049577 TaxID=3155153 RepID=UPI00344A16E1